MTGHILGPVPASLERELFDKYREIERNFREHRWEPSELNGGKLCEVAHTILRGYVDNSFPAHAVKPPNMVDACRELEKVGATFSRSVRIQIPRVIVALYEIRNNRGVGHVGGDVDPNLMDAVCVLQMAKWIVAELIRVFHGVSTDEATALVEAISERELPLIWDTGSVKRVLDTRLTMLEKTLALLYSSPMPLTEAELLHSLEHSNPSVYRRDVLRKAHSQRLLEYNDSDRTVRISPAGMKKFETEVLAKP